MKPDDIIRELEKNRGAFDYRLRDVTAAEPIWKPARDKWCLLEVVCHLCDEEREDFRARVRLALEDPAAEPPKIDPPGLGYEPEIHGLGLRRYGRKIPGRAG